MRPEEQLQRSVVDLLSVYQNRGLLTFCRVPNGGRRVCVCRSVDDVERCLRAEAVPPVGTLAVAISADVQERAS